MFAFFTRSSGPSSPRAGRRARLSLERLETRDCPYTPFTISSFTSTVLANHAVHLSGTVQDDNPASVQLTFSGAVTGTTTANSVGNFSYDTTNASLGTVTV